MICLTATSNGVYSVMVKVTAPDGSFGSEICETLVHRPNGGHLCGPTPRSLSVSVSKYDGSLFQIAHAERCLKGCILSLTTLERRRGM
jgi:hypothetical protein